nr:hypothetical protein [uncultured Dongia sp.]
MPTPTHLRLRTVDPENILWPNVGLLSEYLAQGRYHETRRRKYVAAMLHFGDWLSASNIAPENLDEECIRLFLSKHESGCACVSRTRTSAIILRSALNNLLLVSTRLKVVILAPNVGFDQRVERRDCRISNWPNCRFTK